MRRVVITGMGAITPVGLSVEEFWNSVKEGKTNFAEVTRFDSTNYRAHMAAEINNFNSKDYMIVSYEMETQHSGEMESYQVTYGALQPVCGSSSKRSY